MKCLIQYSSKLLLILCFTNVILLISPRNIITNNSINTLTEDIYPLQDAENSLENNPMNLAVQSNEISSPGTYPYGLASDGTILWNSDIDTNKIYKFFQNGTIITSFNAPADTPTGLAFDGRYLWCACDSTDRIYKINAHNGTIYDSFFAPSTNPTGLAFDGEYLWNADMFADRIFKINTSTGTSIFSFVATNPEGLTFDGTDLWYSRIDNATEFRYSVARVYCVDKSGALVRWISVTSTYNIPKGLAFNGLYLLNARIETNSGGIQSGSSIVSLDPCTGAIEESFTHGWLYYTDGLAFDGFNIWSATDYSNGRFYKTNITDFSTTFAFSSPSYYPQGSTFIESHLWCTDRGTNSVYQMFKENGSIISSFTAPCDEPKGLAFDGAYLWLVDSTLDQLNKIDPNTGSVVSVLSSPAAYPWGLTINGNYMWNVDSIYERIYKIDLTTRTVVDSFEIDLTCFYADMNLYNQLRGLTNDGTHLWLHMGRWSNSYYNEPSSIVKIVPGFDEDFDGMSYLFETNHGLNISKNDADIDPDGDDLTNIEESQTFNGFKFTDPWDNDSDNDDLLDGEEIKIYRTNPLNPDSDFDGNTDKEELLAGTNPNDPLDQPVNLDIVSPSTSLTNNPAQTVTVTSDAMFVELFLNEISQDVQSSGFSWSITLQEGSNNITAVGTNGFTVVANQAHFITLDITPPSVLISSPSYNITNQANQQIDVSTDGSSAHLYLNSASQGSQTSGFTWPIILVEGNNNITAIAFDDAGNEAKTQKNITLDTIGPSVSITSPMITLTNKVNHTVQISTNGISSELFVNDVSQGFNTSSLKWNITLIEGSNNITVRALDSLSNPSTSSIFITLDTQPPDIILDSPDFNLTNVISQSVIITTDGVSAELFVNDTLYGSQISGFSWNILLIEGINNLTLVAVDNAGNQAFESYFIELDTTGPSVQISSPAYSLTNNFTEQINVTSDGVDVELFLNNDSQGVQSSTFSWIVYLIEGQNNLTVLSHDELGNPTTVTKFIELDTIGPAFNFLSPTATITNKESQVVEISSTADLISAELFLNDSSQGIKTTGFTWVITLLDGLNNLTVIAYDQLNNPSINFKFIILDKSIPDLLFLIPTTGLTNSSQQMVTIDTNAVSAVLLINSTSQGSQTSGFSWDVTLEEGLNNLTVIAYSTSDSFAIDYYFITLDSINPTLSISGITEGGIYSDTIIITILSEDTSSGISSVFIWIDNLLVFNQTSSPFNYTLDTTKRFDGAYTIKIMSIDNAGNQLSQEIIIWINNSTDKTAPSTTISGIANGQTYSGILTISISANDPSGINRIELYIDDSLVDVDSEPPYEFIINTSSYLTTNNIRFEFVQRLMINNNDEPSSHSISIVTFDNLGNSDTQTFSAFFQFSTTATIISSDTFFILLLFFFLLIIGGVGIGGYILYTKTQKGEITSFRRFIMRDDGKDVCSICRRKIDDSLRVSCPHCKNVFHEAHFAETVKVTGKCPICQKKIREVNNNVSWD